MSEKISEFISEAKELAKDQRFAESADSFREAFSILPTDPVALRELASVMLELGEVETALGLLADSTDPDQPDVATLRQIATLLRGQNRPDEAADFMICALTHDQENQELLEETRSLLEEVGREAELFPGDAPSA